MPRPTWDEYFMELAQVAKKRSTCLSPAKGAVLVRENRVIATGYNGTPSKTKHCTDGGCARCSARVKGEINSGEALDACACSHAEENAIVQAARHGINTNGAVLYTTYVPCTTCAKMIINAGISKVVAGEKYPDELGTNLMKEAGVELVLFSKPSNS